MQAELTERAVLQKTKAEYLTAVKNLNHWGQEVSDVSILRRMPNLEVLALSVNRIETLIDFQFCHSLRELYMRKNSLFDLRDVHYLSKLPLRILWLMDNPCARSAYYRPFVIKLIPTLIKLDNNDVSPQERAEAESIPLEQLESAIDAEIALLNRPLTGARGDPTSPTHQAGSLPRPFTGGATAADAASLAHSLPLGSLAGSLHMPRVGTAGPHDEAARVQRTATSPSIPNVGSVVGLGSWHGDPFPLGSAGPEALGGTLMSQAGARSGSGVYSMSKNVGHPVSLDGIAPPYRGMAAAAHLLINDMDEAALRYVVVVRRALRVRSVCDSVH